MGALPPCAAAISGVTFARFGRLASAPLRRSSSTISTLPLRAKISSADSPVRLRELGAAPLSSTRRTAGRSSLRAASSSCAFRLSSEGLWAYALGCICSASTHEITYRTVVKRSKCRGFVMAQLSMREGVGGRQNLYHGGLLLIVPPSATLQSPQDLRWVR